MRYAIGLLGAAALVIGLSACSGSAKPAANKATTAASASAAAAANLATTATASGTASPASSASPSPSPTPVPTRTPSPSPTPVPPPQAGFTATPLDGQAPLKVTFTDTSSGQIAKRSWDFGDGGVSAQQNPSHTFTNAGDFIVTLKVEGPGGAATAQWPFTIAPPPPTPTPEPRGYSFGAGTQIVGADIAAATYRTRSGSRGCYWERLSGFGGTLSEIVANENTDGPEVVTIAATDKGFNSTRCGRWTQDLSAITSGVNAPFQGGTYIVGVDIAPGTWRSDGASGCYWQRVRGFSGQLSDIIANNNVDGPAIVTILRTDRGFSSARCGTWTKIQ